MRGRGHQSKCQVCSAAARPKSGQRRQDHCECVVLFEVACHALDQACTALHECISSIMQLPYTCHRIPRHHQARRGNDHTSTPLCVGVISNAACGRAFVLSHHLYIIQTHTLSDMCQLSISRLVHTAAWSSSRSCRLLASASTAHQSPPPTCFAHNQPITSMTTTGISHS
jgi:hypothetical protein